ncbi:hypothetical protein ACFPK9_07180 [Rubritalea spongiae]|uniref:Uncharacterized protein n=1 Tax=Rubritalea spongiae TaxID=430797 RepID=A0ABW5E1C9_9BACT
MKMKQWWMTAVAALVCTISGVHAGELPEVLAKHFDADEPVKAEIYMVVPPQEFEKFVQKLSEAAQKDPEWFNEHSKKTPGGSPIPEYDEKLGMSQEEYDGFVKLWDAREAKRISQTALMVTETGDGKWKLNGSGNATPLSLLSYDPETNTFKSPNGTLESIVDINAPKRSLLGAWTGKEWRYQSENSLTKMKENLALGTSEDGKYSILVYRLQEVTAKGRPMFDQSLVIRFAAKK